MHIILRVVVSCHHYPLNLAHNSFNLLRTSTIFIQAISNDPASLITSDTLAKQEQHSYHDLMTVSNEPWFNHFITLRATIIPKIPALYSL